MKRLKLPQLIGAIFICQLAGIVGSIFTISAIPTWYAHLTKPAFSPPNWIFGPTWTILYTLMGIAMYLIWEKGIQKKSVKEAIWIFGLQLLLNFFWSVIFFGLKQPLLAFGEILFLWLAIGVTMTKFYKLSKTAAYLLFPYILWVSFAAVLNLKIVLLN